MDNKTTHRICNAGSGLEFRKSEGQLPHPRGCESEGCVKMYHCFMQRPLLLYLASKGGRRVSLPCAHDAMGAGCHMPTQLLKLMAASAGDSGAAAATHQYIHRKIVPIMEKRLEIYLHTTASTTKTEGKNELGQDRKALQKTPQLWHRARRAPPRCSCDLHYTVHSVVQYPLQQTPKPLQIAMRSLPSHATYYAALLLITCSTSQSQTRWQLHHTASVTACSR